MESQMAKVTKRKIKNAEPDAGNRREQVTIEPTEEQIRERAYQIFVEHGRVQGHDLENWEQAQRELRADLAK